MTNNYVKAFARQYEELSRIRALIFGSLTFVAGVCFYSFMHFVLLIPTEDFFGIKVGTCLTGATAISVVMFYLLSRHCNFTTCSGYSEALIKDNLEIIKNQLNKVTEVCTDTYALLMAKTMLEFVANGESSKVDITIVNQLLELARNSEERRRKDNYAKLSDEELALSLLKDMRLNNVKSKFNVSVIETYIKALNNKETNIYKNKHKQNELEGNLKFIVGEAKAREADKLKMYFSLIPVDIKL